MSRLPSWSAVYQLGEAFRRLLSASRTESGLPRYVASRARDVKWTGPYYFFGKQWRRDLVLVLEQMRLSVTANAPLGPAFEAATEDFLTQEKGWSPQHAARLFKLAGLGLLLALSLLAALAAVAEDGYEGLPRLLRPGVFGVWLIVAARHQQYKVAAVFASLKTRIDSGHSLSEAMGRLPLFFPKDLVSVVAMAEKTGNLREVLERFSDKSIQQWTAQKDLERVLKYLGTVLMIQFGILSFIIVKVLPVFTEILQEFELSISQRPDIAGFPVPLPSMTDLYVLADFIYTHRFHFAGLAWLVAFWIWIRPRRRRRNWSSRIESSLLLAFPGLRGLVARQNLASIAHVLEQLLRAGVPLEQALRTVSDGDLHPFYRRWLTRVHTGLMNGLSLGESCTRARRLAPVPGSFTSLVTMGERYNNLENAFEYISVHYQGQVERRKQLLMGAILPLGVFVMGYVTLSIELAIFQTMVDMADSIIP